MREKLTVLIPCKNEDKNIRACIESALPIADEILVADSGSTDATMEIAHAMGCRIIEREYVHSGDFKNWAIPQASHPWVFILDADERLTPELVDEIGGVLSAPQYEAYEINRRSYFMGHPIRHGVWWPDRLVRLFRRQLGRFEGANDHALLILQSGRVGKLKADFDHYTFWNFQQYLPKVYRYASVQAQLWNQNGRRSSWFQLVFRGPLRFFQSYILKLGFLDGMAGLLCSAMVGYQSFLKQALLWEIQHARPREEVDRVTPYVGTRDAEETHSVPAKTAA